MQAILDTGPWIALIDRSESMHKQTVEWLQNYSGSLYSTEAVLTEVLYLLNFSIKAQSAALGFILKSVVELVPSSNASLNTSKTLMKKYADLPMDYADATIVCLAMDTGIIHIVTFDQKDFSIYRTTKNKPFNLVLQNE
ncbi:MAG: PIN domain-containing protein [Proteobacteria bacterium]|nr:PIN domain-containing protein [Pseudomonadota bacterium]